jgi:hypothetical protein
MAFIRRKKTSAGQTVYQVVVSRREGKKVRQRVLVSLMYDATIGEAIRSVEGRIADPGTPADWRLRWMALREKLHDVQRRTGLP